MNYYLAPYVGTGSDGDPFRPRAIDGLSGWGCIDLRPDPVVTTGWAFLASPVVLTDPGLRTCGDQLDSLPTSIRNRIQSALGLTLSALTLRGAIAELLIDHARDDGTRWKPLRATLSGMLEIWLVDRIYGAQVPSGGIWTEETFTTADSTTLGPDLSWTETAGDLQVVSNTCRSAVTTNSTQEARAEKDLSHSDNYAMFNHVAFTAPNAADNVVSACCRFQSSARTHYMARRVISSAGAVTEILARRVTGTSANITTASGTFTAGELIRCEADGSTIRFWRANSNILTATDTNITSGTRGGISLTSQDDTAKSYVDSFEMGDLPFRPAYRQGIGRGIMGRVF